MFGKVHLPFCSARTGNHTTATLRGEKGDCWDFCMQVSGKNKALKTRFRCFHMPTCWQIWSNLKNFNQKNWQLRFKGVNTMTHVVESEIYRIEWQWLTVADHIHLFVPLSDPAHLTETVPCSTVHLHVRFGKWATHTPWRTGGGAWALLTGSQVANRGRSAGQVQSSAVPPRWASNPSSPVRWPSSPPAPNHFPQWSAGGPPGPE